MDNIKDIKKDTLLPDTQKTNIADFVERAKKIVTALFMITNLIEKDSGLSTILRQKSLNHFQYFLDYLKDKDINSLKKSQHCLYETLSFIDILYSTSSISEMNYKIISGELRDFQNKMENFIKENESQKHILSDVFFKEKGVHVLEKKHQINTYNNERNVIKKSEKELRHENILKILKEKEKVSINEICILFDSYSAKTVQRDLKELVGKKKVVKRGDRRWATYSLV
jgi:hypothetical protein